VRWAGAVLKGKEIEAGIDVTVLVFDALEKQLGLKVAKRRLPLAVLDHIEPKPAEN
jgi:uncharacterized protein (TIGR03435 family)